MEPCKLAALFDPRDRETDPGRVARALGDGPQIRTQSIGPLALAWSGTPPIADPFAALGALDGAFAAASWDAEAEEGVVARDRAGIQPLFWAVQGGRLHVAWEVATLLALLPRTPGPDLDRLSAWLVQRRPGATERLYEGVGALPAAHAMRLFPAGWRLERYWRATPRPQPAGQSRAAATQALRDGIRRSVRERLPAGGVAGVLLSGGFDSGLVLGAAAAEARAAGADAPVAYCVTFPQDPHLDESRWREPMVTAAGVRAVRVPSGMQPLTPTADAFAARYRVPLEFPSFVLFLAARQRAAVDGVRVLLNGEGGDELFGCEPFLITDRLAAGRAAAALRLTLGLPGMSRPPSRRALRVVARDMIAPALLGPAGLRRLRRLRGSAAADVPPPWLRPERAAHLPAGHEDAWRAAGDGPRWLRHRRWLLTDGRDALGVENHLRRIGALGGVEGASPLLDHGLVELVLGLPPGLAFDRARDRALARDAAHGLVAEPVRTRQGKTFFDELIVRSLEGPDRAAVRATLGAQDLRLGAVVSREAVRASVEGGSGRHPGRPAAWASETWRLWAAERWLRDLED